jgi:hypothetical protein
VFKRICKLFVVVLLAVPVAACNPVQFTPDHEVRCDTYPVQPAVMLQNGVPTVETHTISYCQAPPIEVIIHVWMERLNFDGKWLGVNGVNGGFSDCSEIPTLAGSTCSYTLNPCEDGTYRTRVTITYTEPDGNHVNFDSDVRPKGEIKCP